MSDHTELHDSAPELHEHDLSPHPLYPSWRNPWVIIAAVLVLTFVFGVASIVHRAFSLAGPVGTAKVRTFVGGPGGPIMQRVMGSRAYGAPSLLGAVTAVNGSTLTVAGNGASTTVDTSSSTTYVGASSALLDDTVEVFGTSSNGTLTASQIIVNPQ